MMRYYEITFNTDENATADTTLLGTVDCSNFLGNRLISFRW